MKKAYCIVGLVWLLAAGYWPSTTTAAPVSAPFRGLLRYLSKEAAGETVEKITKEVGEEVVERVARKVIREGGEESLENVAKLVAKHGPDVIRALDNAPSVKSVLKALDDLPADQVPKAAARLAAGASGKELAEATIQHGSKVLRAELAHPGVGGRFVAAFGDDGASLCGKLDTDQAVALGRYIDDIAKAPPTQRQQLLEIVDSDKDRFFGWLGEFVKENPGKTIGSAAFLAAFLPNAEQILGGTEEIEYDENGNPVTRKITKSPLGPEGPIYGALKEGLSLLTNGIAWVVIGAVALFASIKLFGVWRRDRRHR